ncbi:MAG: SH3 domain-containing protein [Alicyclobacillus sp.]|nr:SH3 domain-containing protein [Alicyclobacillus sp.]
MTHLPPHVTPEMLTPDFWVAMSPGSAEQPRQRADVQAQILAACPPLQPLMETWPGGGTRVEPALPPSPPPTLYDGSGQPLSDAFWTTLGETIRSARAVREPAAIGTASGTAGHPAFAVCRADVRRYPIAEGGFREAGDRALDRFQDTALHTFEPVLVLYETLDRGWYFVRSRTYVGWVEQRHIALATPEQFHHWGRFTENPTGDFVIPLSNAVSTQANPFNPRVSRRPLEFAAYIPACPHNGPVGQQSPAGQERVWMPVRNADGWLEVDEAFVSATLPLSKGFRPYTRASVITSAFALLGERYGWGDAFGCHDCSSLVMDSYRTVGVQLPRDADEQEACLPNPVTFPPQLSFAERAERFFGLGLGDPLYMPGHTMLYLGFVDGHHYVLHDFAGYADGATSVPVYAVMVSTLDIRTRQNHTYLEALTTAGRLFA